MYIESEVSLGSSQLNTFHKNIIGIYKKNFDNTWTGSSRTPEQIGHTSSSSTSP